MFKAGKAVRVLFLIIATLILLGLWLSGFEKLHWFTYVVPSVLIFAAVTGFCPGLIVTQRIFGKG